MKNRTILVVCFVLLIASLTASCQSSEGDAVELSKAIERSLPRGSSYDSVVRFMEQRGIEYTNPEEVEGYDPSGTYGRQHVLSGTRIRSILGVERSRVRVVFYFSADRLLSGSVVTASKS